MSSIKFPNILKWLPLIQVIVFSVGITFSFVTAFIYGDVNLYLPFISETGAFVPEMGIFSFTLIIGSVIGIGMILYRYLLVKFSLASEEGFLQHLNTISLFIGFSAMFGLAGVAAFPMTTVFWAHLLFAGIYFSCMMFYLLTITFFSYKRNGYSAFVKFRIALTICIVVFLTILVICFPIGLKKWHELNHTIPALKVPDDKKMVSHSWKKLDCFPLVFVIVFSIGIVVPCILALMNGHVTPYMPYISEGGGTMPEAGIFSACICFSSFICQCIMCFRYLVVEHLNSERNNDMNRFLNKLSLTLGSLSSIFMILVASYSAKSVPQVHNAAAGAACVCYVMYTIFQTWISFRILGRTKTCYWRLILTIGSLVSLILVTVFGLLGSSQWTLAYWAGNKMPDDKGFRFYVISASAEWIMALLLILYYFSYASEFKKSTFTFQMEVIDRSLLKQRLSNLYIRHP